jgi:hypothetical protein
VLSGSAINPLAARTREAATKRDTDLSHYLLSAVASPRGSIACGLPEQKSESVTILSCGVAIASP